ncbi:MAG: hypothetical protein AVDCRST_MAG77-6157, partial [uncultured Chloroflexi bacterium]
CNRSIQSPPATSPSPWLRTALPSSKPHRSTATASSSSAKCVPAPSGAWRWSVRAPRPLSSTASPPAGATELRSTAMAVCSSATWAPRVSGSSHPMGTPRCSSTAPKTARACAVQTTASPIATASSISPTRSAPRSMTRWDRSAARSRMVGWSVWIAASPSPTVLPSPLPKTPWSSTHAAASSTATLSRLTVVLVRAKPLATCRTKAGAETAWRSPPMAASSSRTSAPAPWMSFPQRDSSWSASPPEAPASPTAPSAATRSTAPSPRPTPRPPTAPSTAWTWVPAATPYSGTD